MCVYLRLAWYDHELVQYQKERAETELEKTFEDRRQYLSEQGGINVKYGEHLKPKIEKKEDTEWQQVVKGKKGEEFYNKLQTIDQEQLLKETKHREESHQFAIPGQKVVQSSMAKGMAQKYLQNL